ncbi:TPA: glycosyltransferase [Streptococcus suis]
MTRGRDDFLKYKKLFGILSRCFSFLPRRGRIFFYNLFQNTNGKIGIGLRYVNLKSLVKSIGDNVAVYPNVYMKHLDKLEIGNNVSLNPMCYLDANGGLKIGDDVSIAHGVTLLSDNHKYDLLDIPIKDQGMQLKETVIENNVWLGAKVTGLGTAVENSGPMQFLAVNLYKFGLRKAQKVFFQNAENRDFMIRKGAVKGAYDMLPGSGVNLNNYTVTEYPDGETVDFVFVSRIMKEKGIDQYLDAAKKIRKKYPETRFHVCGFCEQAYEDELKKLHEDGTIVYHGLVKDMAEIYRQMSCTVHPTYYPEGFSNVLLESAASGRPIITTNRSGCREVVDNGVNGYVVEEKNSQDLIQKIEMFLDKSVEERRAMGLAGRAKVEKEFNRKIVIDKYLAELKRV